MLFVLLLEDELRVIRPDKQRLSGNLPSPVPSPIKTTSAPGPLVSPDIWTLLSWTFWSSLVENLKICNTTDEDVNELSISFRLNKDGSLN